MPVSRSDVLIFFGGLAAGATACATYPKWKDKLSPLVSGAIAGVTAAYRDANASPDGATADGASDTKQEEPEPTRRDDAAVFIST
jgi:hypothetical protein